MLLVMRELRSMVTILFSEPLCSKQGECNWFHQLHGKPNKKMEKRFIEEHTGGDLSNLQLLFAKKLFLVVK